MAVTITQAALSAALRLGDSAAETAEATRLLSYAAEAVARHVSVAPDAVHNESVVRLAAYLYDQPNAGRGMSYANAIRSSGASQILLPWRVHRAGNVAEAVQAAQQAAAATGNSVVDVEVSGSTLTVTFEDGSTRDEVLPEGMAGDVDQAARDSAGRAQAAADRAQAAADEPDLDQTARDAAAAAQAAADAPDVDQPARDAAAAAQATADAAGGSVITVTRIERTLSDAFGINSAVSVLVGVAALDAVPNIFTILRFHFGEFTASATLAEDLDTGVPGTWHEMSKREFDGLVASEIGDGLLKESCRVYRDFYDADIEGAGAFAGLTGRDVAVARDADRNLLFALGNASKKCRNARVEIVTETDVDVRGDGGG